MLLFIEELTPVCAPSLLHSAFPNGHENIVPNDLDKFNLLHSDTCTLNWQYWLEDTKAAEVLANANSTNFDSCMLSYDAATAGLGFAIANYVYMMKDIEAGRLIAPFKDKLRSGFGWYFVYPSTSAHLPRVQKFQEWVLKQAIETRDKMELLIAGESCRLH